MRILGIDYGSRRIGLALGDTDSRIASPWGVLPNEGIELIIDRLSDMVQRDDIEKFVVGIPKPLRKADAENPQVRETKEFIEALRDAGFVVDTENEALTSKLAQRQAEEAGDWRKRDDLAAAAILQSWLDRKKKGGGSRK
ncbi:RuvX/YqgF family protein [Patescibacteria group bacterium]|uniref:Putative pre-16S rRNA nuclease n=1 Tax=candidate division WWE3 bacterium TaxID=2053526 RepID=A0A928TTI2_UNCKA|nr:pre-16S rRNA-processing nuclease YqgF [candidate division WWE3 bacterium]MCL4732777.1 RuvX/YqgF family protein [Patescibacteria group bacterium]MDL1952906.1 pre-16S rRNA-processing nuclease YqgF [Candidatus Uhrbacteria bacterium UHB]RIL00626.1 MAG: hypothetical protein DCC77_03695 [Candidatus Uhrbacteria bacterium]